VAFEPTPGRGAPGAEAYTGIAEQQAAPGEANVATTVAGGGAGPPITPSTIDPSATTSSVPLEGLGEGLSTSDGSAAPDDDPFVERAGRYAVWLIGIAALVALLYVGSLIVVRDARRRARRRAAATPSGRIRLAGAEVTEAAPLLGLGRSPHETHREYSRRLGGALPELDDDVRALFGNLERADYAPVEADEADAGVATMAGEHVTGAIRSYAGSWRVLQDELHWRHLIGEPRARRQAAAPVRGTSPSGVVAAEPVSHAAAGIAE
jgi:hypothetical protein